MTLEQEIKELEKQYLVEKEEGFARIIVIDNLPIVDSAKLAKLTTVLIKILSKEVENIVSDAIFMPFNSENTSNGYAFVTLTTPASVKKALKSLNGYKLDKSHVLQVNLFDDIEKFANLDETFIEPKPEKFIEKDHLKSWLYNFLTLVQMI